MKNKGRLLLLIVLLLALIGGANYAYQKLAVKNMPPKTDLSLSKEDTTQENDNVKKNNATQKNGNTAKEDDTEKEDDSTNTDSTKKEDVPNKIAAADFSVVDLDGNEVLLSNYYGKPIVLNFWASWCGPCQREMPDFEEVYLDQGEEIQFLMINITDGMRETVEKGSAYVEKQGFTFPVFYDTEQNAAITYGVTSYPTTYFIDKEGYVVAGQKGVMSKDTLLQGIELAKNSTTTTNEVQTISGKEAYELMKTTNPFVLLDVRTQSEFDESHIEGALLVPDTEIEARIEKEIPDKNTPVFLYCRSGRRSAEAAIKMKELGYTTIYDFGGINDWEYETVSN